jgi:hypothetical protein
MDVLASSTSDVAIGRAESETLRDALRLLVSDDFTATFEHTLSE